MPHGATAVAVLLLITISGVSMFALRYRRSGSWPGLLVRIFPRRVTGGAAHDGEVQFHLLAEAIPQIVWTASSDGRFDYCNQRFYALTGLSKEKTLGLEGQKAIHPDDLPAVIQKWEDARRTGSSFEIEYRLKTVQGDFRWHLGRATPMMDSSGAIVKWYGACTDIDDQMRHQQVLEEQVKQHVEALMEANFRLESEMRERALAQHELDAQSGRMLRELTMRSNRLTNLVKMAELLQSSAEVKDACSVMAGMGPKIFPELRGAVLLLDSPRKRLELGASWSECDLPASSFGPQECLALRTGRAHTIAAGDTNAGCEHVTARQYSYICLPLLAHDETIGLLHFQAIEPSDLSPPVILSANMFAEQVGLSVANIRLREALRDQSIRDPLTGLYNRRYLQETMDRETRRAIRAEHGMGVLMLDLDHFKNFNDTYGHEAGDTVLCETASFLLKSVRAEDVVCRFGGEEFVILLPMADLKATRARAERIRSKLRELPVMHQGRSVGRVTVSVGVAELPEHGTTHKELLEAADAALYRAKREGRDRVMVAEPAPTAESQLREIKL